MAHATSQRLFAVLCLVAIGFGQVVFGTLGVRCEDTAGQSRFELACVTTPDGSCVNACASVPDDSVPCEDDGEHAPHPCKDSPVGEAAKVVLRKVAFEPVQMFAALAVATEQIAIQEGSASPGSVPAWVNARPPDTVARLRTVILVV